MILRGRKQQVRSAVDQGVDRTFGARQKLFDNDFPAGIAEASPVDHVDNGRVGLASVLSNNDAFAESQAVGFDC